MAIQTIEVKSYRSFFGASERVHNAWQTFVQQQLPRLLTSANLRRVTFYNLNAEQHEFFAGERNRSLNIYNNATFKGAGKGEIPVAIINSIQTTFTDFLNPTGKEGNIIITSEEGLPLAEYQPSTEELNILFNLMSAFNETNQTIFKYIMTKFESLVWFPKTLENSWIHTSNKDALLGRFKERMIRQKGEQIRRDKNQIAEYERYIEDYTRSIKSNYDNVIRLRRSVETEEKNMENVNEQLIKDIDLVSQHEKVKDVHVIDGVFHVFTHPLYVYTAEGERFYLGTMKFTMNTDNTEVRFFNLDNPRQGYWTSQDPHPHVDGSRGNACLGSVATTIAELCARNEIYALALTCIDFLENANTSDPAGARVYNWDRVDDDGNVIQEGGEETWTCEHCEDTMSEHMEGVTVYGGVIDGDPSGELYVCRTCQEGHYPWSEHYQEYMHEDIDDPEEDDE